MRFSIKAPNSLNGSIMLPASKSISNRALILNALSGGGSTVENLADCDDTNVMVRALKFKDYLIDIGAAGTSMRFLTAYFSLRAGKIELTGTERMKNRPIGILVDALRKLGANIEYTEKVGYPPLKISGKKMKGGKIQIDGSISSQYLSALMMIGPKMEDGLTLHIKGKLISRPYAEMTLKMMETYGVEADWTGNEIIITKQEYQANTYTVESDWSAASYWYEMLCLVSEGEIFLKGLLKNSLQGDSRVAVLFEDLGIHTDFSEDGVKLSKTKNIVENFLADLSDQPDLAQTLALTCVLKNIPFILTGLKSLRIKETDRINSLIAECKKLGFILVEANDNILEWTGERCETLPEAIIETYEDHRMAMAFAPASLTGKDFLINHPEVVSKSYTNFWNDLKSMGFTIISK